MKSEIFFDSDLDLVFGPNGIECVPAGWGDLRYSVDDNFIVLNKHTEEDASDEDQEAIRAASKRGLHELIQELRARFKPAYNARLDYLFR